MNPAYNQFVTFAAKDGILFFGLLQTAKRFASWWLRAFILVFLFIPFIVFAQIVPFYFRKHLSIIFPVLPDIKDRDSLFWLRDAFSLYFYTLKGYRSLCMFRKSMDVLIDELDEHIDSISFAIENPNIINQALANAESSKRPASL